MDFIVLACGQGSLCHPLLLPLTKPSQIHLNSNQPKPFPPIQTFNQTHSQQLLNSRLLKPAHQISPINSSIISASTNPPPIQTNPSQHQSSCDHWSPGHPKVTDVIPTIGKSTILEFLNSDKADLHFQSMTIEPNQTNPISLVLPLNSNSVRPSVNLVEKVLDLSVDLLLATCVDRSMDKNNREITSLSEEEDRESGPPGFKSRMDKSSEESSLETAIHVSEETSSLEEEVNGFSSSHARLVREKLGIIVLGMENANKTFAKFCRNRQKEVENIRKKSVVPDVTNKFEEASWQKAVPHKTDGGRRKEKG